ncbi:hypothetical protein Bbelb_260120 [Branchiostoma belcheri]|nr:hypothetical protein Bbelb_260120 [Branchiostoma belcheri]
MAAASHKLTSRDIKMKKNDSLCGRARHICFTDAWCARRKECEKKKKGIKRHMNERYENPPDYEAEVMCYTKNNVHRCVLSVMTAVPTSRPVPTRPPPHVYRTSMIEKALRGGTVRIWWWDGGGEDDNVSSNDVCHHVNVERLFLGAKWANKPEKKTASAPLRLASVFNPFFYRPSYNQPPVAAKSPSPAYLNYRYGGVEPEGFVRPYYWMGGNTRLVGPDKPLGLNSPVAVI